LLSSESFETFLIIFISFHTAELTIGSILPVDSIPEGTVVCIIEESPGDCGKMARAGGGYGLIVAQDTDKGVTRVRLPSGSVMVVSSTCRAMVGIIAGGGRTDKPLMELVVVIEPRAVEWEVVNREENHEAHMLNAKYCISAARKIGACVFLTPEDIVEVKSKMILTFVAGLWMADLVRLQPMVEGLHTGHFVFDGMKGK
jgi:hypothetical protein